MKETGVMTSNMAMEQKVGQMVLSMLENILMARKKVKASSHGLMEIPIRASSKKTKYKVLVLTLGVTKGSTKGIGKIIK